ncbi:acyltransferase family protein [Actinocorallia sp. A-T 12471]|uniref:acyltransferase family protein n=1 Tax=Actinocorallia sp. A-T 12471 TaxID=3089813 RepID=UPI0029D310A5|nr:acyltransferase family protein [Actinocorallia sp. A-T 12471]MDX6744634.1 acyltransferase family protein [Actinocorallia sp. A-T 12471]
MTQITVPGPAQAKQTAQAAQTAVPKARDPFFDNAKYLAILLVVIGHSIVGMRTTVEAAGGLYTFLHLFHMPLFIVITGYFSRTFSFSRRKAQRLLTNVGVPYVIFEVAYSLWEWHFNHKPTLEISLLNPIYLTWFLLALFLWRLSTPVWQQIRWPLGVAVGISLLAYTAPLADDLEMHRVFGLAPFYVLGLCLRPEHFEVLRRRWARPVGAAVLAAAFAGSFWVKDRVDYRWFYWRDAHDQFGVGNLTGTAMRLAMMVTALVLVAAFLAVVPRGRHWFTGLGAATIFSYLLHGFVIKYAQFQEWDHAAFLQNGFGLVATVVFAVVLGTALCTPPVRKIFRWAVEPRASWAFTRK